MRAKRKCRKTWQFPSNSTPGKVYTVSLWETDELTCNCPAWTFKRGDDRTCPHVRGVAASLIPPSMLETAGIGTLRSVAADMRAALGKGGGGLPRAIEDEDVPLRRVRFLEDRKEGDDAL